MISDRVDNEIHRNLVFFLGDIRDDVDVAEAFTHAEAFIHLVGGSWVLQKLFLIQDQQCILRPLAD